MTAPHIPNGTAGVGSFDRFVKMNFATAYRFAFCMSLTHDKAADLTQSAFAKAQRAQLHGTDAALARRWLLAALHNEWAGDRPPTSAGVGTESSSLADGLIEPRDVAGLDQADVLVILHRMKEKLRLALSLFYFEQLSYAEIAEILETPPEMVLVHLAEAKTLLRRELEENRKEPVARPRVSATEGRPGG